MWTASLLPRPGKRPKIWTEACKRQVHPEKRPKIWTEPVKCAVCPEKRLKIWTEACTRTVRPEKRPKIWTEASKRPADKEGPVKTLRGEYSLLYGGSSASLKSLDYRF